MKHIKSRKHPPRSIVTPSPRVFSQSALALSMTLALPGVGMAQQNETVLPEVRVTAPGSPYKAEVPASTKYTAPLVNTPKSVTVVTRQVLQETNALTLQDALRTVPGITFNRGEGGNPEGDRPFLRGYDAQASTYVDGLRDPASQSRDMFNVEQVDVVKGPDSAYSGGGAVGGSINLSSKQARLGNFAEAGLGLGTASYKRATVDVNRQIAEHAAVRLNLMKEKSDVAGRDAVYNDRLGAAFSVGVGLGTATRAGLDLYHFETDDLPDYGIPYNNPYAAGTPNAQYNGNGGPLHVDRDNFYGLKDRDFRKTRTDAATLRFEHDLNDKWTLRNRTRYYDSRNDYVASNPGDSRGLNLTPGNILVGSDPVLPGHLWRSQKSRNSSSDGIINATELTGEFNIGSVKNNLAAGIEFSSAEVDSRGYSVTGFSAANINNPNPDDPWTGRIARATAGTKIKTKTRAVYVFDTLTLNRQWLLNLGGRWDHFDTKQTPYTTNGSAPNVAQYLENKSHFWSWQAGVVFKPAENGSIYLNYSTSATPSGIATGDGASGVSQDTLSATNQDLEPEKTRSYELGTKWDLLDNRLAVSAALFDMKRSNAKVNVAAGVMDTAGTQKVRGFELGVAGAITNQWSVSAGYSRIDSELADPGPLSADKGKQFPNTPKNSFSLWSHYRVLPALTLGGGAYYVSKVYGNTANTKWVPSYWRFDAMANYEINKNVSLRLNVQNLFDKTYYDKAYATHQVSVGQGRQGILSVNLKF